jgi:hypothetical protein
MRNANWRRLSVVALLCTGLLACLVEGVSAQQPQKKPNIVVIWGDDIGTWNVSHNNRGMMGSPAKACRSPITTASRVARPVAPLSSVATFRFAPG